MWILGIDPGLGMTGLCLLDPDGTPKAAACLKAEGPEQVDLVRYSRLSCGVSDALIKWCRLFSIDELMIGIEYPVMKASNVVNYRKQASTIAIMELQLVGEFSVDYLVEVNPTEVKKAATGRGDATKAEIIKASPLTGSGKAVEAMADAWAVAVAACDAPIVKRIVVSNLDHIPYGTEAEVIF